MQPSNLDVFLRNNTGNKSKKVLTDGFVVRLKTFQTIFQDIDPGSQASRLNNYLIIGQRGAGKTTLLHRLKYAIEDDPKLNQRLIPIMFNEEQYHLTELLNLWESISEQLEELPEFRGIYDQLQSNLDGSEQDQQLAYLTIKKQLQHYKKNLIVFIENIDRFLKKIGIDEQKKLKELLWSSNNIRLVGSATTYFEGVAEPKDAFYNFFKVVQLNGLNKAESIKLLSMLGEQTNQLSQIQHIIKFTPKRIESLRRLTGGNPRTIAYLFQIFLDNENGKAIIDLYRLLDDLTFLYKAELDQLSTQQQKVIDVIAKNWDAISVKEIVAKIKIDSRHVSSILAVLEKNQVIETVATKKKNNLYRLKDRFLNIWYLMRFGRKRDKENIIWLVRFYDAWCDKRELKDRIITHIKDLQSGKYDSLAALDMGNTFLSCENVPPELKYSLYQTTKSFLPKELISDLKLSEKDLYESIKQLVKKKDFDRALSILDEIKIKDSHYYTFYYWIYYNQRDYAKAVEYLEKVFNFTKAQYSGAGDEIKQVGIIAYNVAKLYETVIKDYSMAIKFYKEALAMKVRRAAHRLGQIYYYDYHNFEEAVEYHKIAIDDGLTKPIMSLATIYYKESYYEDAEALCRLAIEKGDNDARNNLSIILQNYGKYDEAIDVLKTAFENGSDYALINLGKLHLNKPQPEQEKALSYFLKAVEKDVPAAYFNIGKYYLKENQIAEGERYLRMGLERHDAESAHILAHHYHKLKQWKKAEKMFLSSFEWGKKSSLVCLFSCAFISKKSDRKGFILEKFEKHLGEIKGSGPLVGVLYSQLLLWNDRNEEAISNLHSLQPDIKQVLDRLDKQYEETLISELTDFFIQMIAKGLLNEAEQFFKSEEYSYKQILKPVYFALMSYLQNEYPNEYLKAGAELQETIDEIVDEIELLKALPY